MDNYALDVLAPIIHRGVFGLYCQFEVKWSLVSRHIKGIAWMDDYALGFDAHVWLITLSGQCCNS